VVNKEVLGVRCCGLRADQRRSRGIASRFRGITVAAHQAGKDFDADEARRFEAELLSVQNHLDEAGVEHEVRQLVRGNDPSQDLIEVAHEVNADFIVIGLRRRTPVGKLILGSNAQRILLDASCPVLAVKAGVSD